MRAVLVSCLCSALASAGATATATATATESLTLKRIAETGIISLGYREASMPFSYLDGRQRPVGYSLDICLHIVEAVKRR